MVKTRFSKAAVDSVKSVKGKGRSVKIIRADAAESVNESSESVVSETANLERMVREVK